MKADSKEYYIALLSLVLGTIIILLITQTIWVAFISFGLGFIGLAFPNIMLYLLKGIQFIQHKLGKAITAIILTTIFFLFLTPLAFLSRVGKKSKLSNHSAFIDRNVTYEKKSFKNTW